MEGLVACPVCTLYLREGMSLNNHLETHPKEQVIAALVRCVNSERDRSLSSSGSSHPFQVVAEEHIIFGRQQVATNLIGPIVTYPIFSGQGILHSSSVAPMTGSDHYLQQRSSPQHQISKNANHQDSSDRASLDGGNVTAQSGQVLTTLVNVTSSDQQSLDGGLSGKDEQYEAIDDDMYHEESPKVQAKIEPMTVISSVSSEDEEEEEKRQTDSIAVVDLSPLATYNDSGEVNELADEGFLNSKMKPSMMDDHSTSNLDTKSPPADQIVASDLPATISYKSDYFSTDDALQGTPTMEDASNHGYYDDELVDDFQRRQYLEEQEDDVEAHSDSGLQNIQADECMPARGELSGHGSVNTAHSWNHDELRMLAPIWEGKTEAVRRYTCLYCDGEFACPKERRLHVATVHCAPNADTKPGDLLGTNNQPRAVMCIKCGLQLESLKDLRNHVKMEHKKVTRQCCVCQEEFKSQEEYIEHITKVHPLECRTCGKTFKSKSSLVSHAKIHLSVKPHACTLCPKTFITSQKLKEHMNGHTGYAPIQCNMCDKKFKRYSNLKQHKDSVHFQVKKPAKEFICECGETFVTKKKFEWHKETHDGKPKQCMYCSERYVHSTSLTRHIRKAHNCEYLPPEPGAANQDSSSTAAVGGNASVSSSSAVAGSVGGTANTGGGAVKKKNVVCPICNLTFVNTSLRAHMKQHGTVKQFGCIVCGKRFYTKWNLQLHRWTHASRLSKPFKCTLCKGAFIRQNDLQAHIRSHLNSKPFTCNHCGMQFNRKPNHTRHEREHLNEKKYECQECGKSFHRHYYLVEHLRTHSGAKPYACHICNKTSATKSNHNKHIRTHHAREAVNTES
ncbi:ZnF_C2H2 [Nesidiocoris tenuis]|uniref:ZnF_C2H2 n=1 Tax=Nesidiocoris tenuis TaxID=355587 RepID=A0ABN7ALU3_9HEMI|nr:ZnF_C2H2 [Nesidiocoris tenuis]